MKIHPANAFYIVTEVSYDYCAAVRSIGDCRILSSERTSHDTLALLVSGKNQHEAIRAVEDVLSIVGAPKPY
jgi:hypothetical protein